MQIDEPTYEAVALGLELTWMSISIPISDSVANATRE